MKGTIYLIGGGEIRRGETAEIDNELKELAPTNGVLAFFGTAARDSLEYSKTIESVFKNELKVITPTEKDGREFALSAIHTASIIYLGGGTTELLLDLFEKWRLIEPLRDALNRGAHLVGMSAGAQALSAWYFHEDEDFMELRRGWNLVPVCVLVHANEYSVARAKILWEESQTESSIPFIAIGEGTAWRVSPSDAQKIGNGEIWK